MSTKKVQVHTLSVLCEDVDGIISRISGMFTRRAFSIISISSGRTEVEGVNRITIIVEGQDHVWRVTFITGISLFSCFVICSTT